MGGREEPAPLYQRIYASLHEDIMSGALVPGDRIKSEKELSVAFGVSRITSKKALEMLAAQGLVRRVPGKGTFVSETPVDEANAGVNGDGRGALIGVLVADFADSFGTKLLYGIESRCRELGNHIVLYRSQDDPSLEDAAIREFLRLGVAGIIIMPVHGEYYSETILRLVLDKFPLVFVDRHLEGLAATYVGTDNVEAARTGVNYLFELGHRAVSFMSPKTEHTSTIIERMDGFVRSHAEHGVAIDRDLWVTGLTSTIARNKSSESVKADIDRVRAHLAAHPEITAVFAEEFDVGLIVQEAAAQLGKTVPEDLSILSIDCPMSIIEDIPFTHLRQRELEMGVRAADLINTQLTVRDGIQKILLPAELLIGSSTSRK